MCLRISECGRASLQEVLYYMWWSCHATGIAAQNSHCVDPNTVSVCLARALNIANVRYRELSEQANHTFSGDRP
jgi:hypothetical protein